ncbi:MAG: phosphate ABC transporter permease PstA [Chitinivibrionales bacterium]|nr:phosphate ABC transporter permease PstA [Chitinivibrionales bacterium]
MMNHTIDVKEKKILRRRKRSDRIFKALVLLGCAISILPLLLIFAHLFKEGFSSLRWEFFISLPKPVGVAGGGILHAIVGSFILIGMATAFSVPIGITVGVFLSQRPNGWIPQTVRLCAEVIQGIPSIVIGICAYIWVVRPMNHFTALSGSIALAVMMLPVIIKTTEETLKLVPSTLRDASLALGAPVALTMVKVIVPAGLGGIITGTLIAVARIAGETAPLLFTAFGNQFMNMNVMKPMGSLPQVIFTYAISPYDEWHALAWGASCVLIILVVCLNIGTKVLANRWKTEYKSL